MIQKTNPFSLRKVITDPAFKGVRILIIISALLGLVQFVPGYTLWLGCETLFVGNVLFVIFETYLILDHFQISSIGKRMIAGIFWGFCLGAVPDISTTITSLIYDFLLGGFKIDLIIFGHPIRPFTFSDIWSLFVSSMILDLWLLIFSAFVGLIVSFIHKRKKLNLDEVNQDY